MQGPSLRWIKVILVFVPDPNSRTTTLWKNQKVDPVELREHTPHQPGQKQNTINGNKEKAEIPNPLIYRIHPLIKEQITVEFTHGLDLKRWPPQSLIFILLPVLSRLIPYGYDKIWEKFLLSIITETTHSPLENISWFPLPYSIKILCLFWIPWVSSSFFGVSNSCRSQCILNILYLEVMNGHLVRFKTSL